MKQRALEIIVGAAVIGVAVFFVNLVMNKAQVTGNNDKSYLIEASFSNAEGIGAGTSVSIAGVKIGVVIDKQINQTRYNAVVKMRINNDIKIPLDSNASIVSSGLIGDKFLTIEPGADEKNIQDGGEIKYTQSSVSLESMIGKMIFSKNENSDKNTKNEESK